MIGTSRQLVIALVGTFVAAVMVAAGAAAVVGGALIAVAAFHIGRHLRDNPATTAIS